MPSNSKWRENQKRQAILVIFLIGALAAGIYSYARYRETASLLPVTFEFADGKSSPTFYLEIANTPSLRTKGLMFVRSLPESRGMLFIFPDESARGFWMKNTFIPLDMIFINSEFEVVGVVANAEPHTEERRSVPGTKSQYVVELNGGVAEKLGIRSGTKLVLKGDIPKPI